MDLNRIAETVQHNLMGEVVALAELPADPICEPAAIILAFQDVGDESYVVGMIVMPADGGRAHITNTRYGLDKKSAVEDYIHRVRRDVLR